MYEVSVTRENYATDADVVLFKQPYRTYALARAAAERVAAALADKYLDLDAGDKYEWHTDDHLVNRTGGPAEWTEISDDSDLDTNNVVRLSLIS